MHLPRRASATLPLLLTLLAACGPEFDDEYDELELDDEYELIDAPLPSSELGELDAPEPESEPTSACSMNLPNQVWANWLNEQTVYGSLPNITSGQYTLEVDRIAGQGLHWFEVDVDGTYLGWGTSSHVTTNFYAESGDPLELFLNAPAGAPPGYFYSMQARLYTYPGHQLVCSDITTMSIPGGCIGVGWWYQQPFPTPTLQGDNCHVADLPPGAQPFIYQSAWYVTPDPGTTNCSIGTYDGANCYIGIAPLNRTGFIANNKLYYNAYAN